MPDSSESRCRTTVYHNADSLSDGAHFVPCSLTRRNPCSQFYTLLFVLGKNNWRANDGSPVVSMPIIPTLSQNVLHPPPPLRT